MIRVAVVDDQELVRVGLCTLLTHAPDMDVVGEAADGLQAVDLARRAMPDVMLLDVRMPGLDGVEAARRISADESLVAVRIIMLTTFDAEEYIVGALRAGAAGFLLKDAAPEEILAAVRVVAAGEALLAPKVTRRLLATFANLPVIPPTTSRLLDDLTPRELEILRLVGRGMSNQEIAETLVISHATVKTHVSRVLTKLGVRDRAQLVVVAFQAGLVTGE